MTQAQQLRRQLETLPPEQVVHLLCVEFMKMEFRAETAEARLANYLAENTPQRRIARVGMKTMQARVKQDRPISGADVLGRSRGAAFARKHESAA